MKKKPAPYKTIFVDLKVVSQSGPRPVFKVNASIHTFNKEGISGDLPVLELSEEENETLQELGIAVAGFCHMILLKKGPKL